MTDKTINVTLTADEDRRIREKCLDLAITWGIHREQMYGEPIDMAAITSAFIFEAWIKHGTILDYDEATGAIISCEPDKKAETP